MSNHKAFIALIKSLAGQANVLTIPRVFIELTGDINAALLLSQCIYWSDKSKREDGFFYKSYRDWTDEIGLSQYQIKRAASVLESMKLLETKRKRANGAPTIHYKISIENLTNSIMEKLDNQETSQSDCEETSQCLTETTQETTISSPTSGEACAEEIPPKKPRKLSERQQAISVLENLFAEKRKLPLPKRDTARQKKAAAARWWGPLGEIWEAAGSDTARAASVIERAIDQMTAGRMTVSAPQSIEQVALSLIADGAQKDGFWL